MLKREDIQYLRDKVLEKTGIDLAYYKENQLQRRLPFIISRAGAQSVEEYVELLDKNPQVLEDFKNRFAINVSEFFRNPERYEDLKNKVLPKLMKEAGLILKIWSAGCSVGSEPYSLAMVLEEMPHRKPYRIWATDIDEDALEKAKEGVYSEDFISNVPSVYLEKYFQFQGEGKYAVVHQLKKRITFEKHDLLQDEVKETFALVVCRNVIIYFEDEAKKIAFKKMSDALQKGGYLWVGSTERITDPSSLGLRYVLPFFYQKGG
ncbi:MAG TPA: protein-glutamate O-methyltransferase CheR [Candidatus Atribacteria bacterium]|nr:protein-glutamate O-methyltransferase CheR [Candidatus Atribacteria bacterium]